MIYEALFYCVRVGPSSLDPVNTGDLSSTFCAKKKLPLDFILRLPSCVLPLYSIWGAGQNEKASQTGGANNAKKNS